jgi:hypothetical protein
MEEEPAADAGDALAARRCKVQQVPPAAIPVQQAEPKILFRADTDQNGDWYVWRKLSKNGWATMRRCECREIALDLAESMNRDPEGAIFHG